MKGYLILLIVAITVFNVEAWQAIILSDNGTEHLGDCYTTEDGIGSMKLSEQRQLKGECVLLRCSDDRQIIMSGCGVADTEPPCILLPRDFTKDYPECCEQDISCPPEPAAFF
uniref:Uncharacterized protein LOC114346900 n=1 Tax=Diabrotica virgifera virgifera TaxID=50390 RepID=A0A6P7H4I2_DIAVI